MAGRSCVYRGLKVENTIEYLSKFNKRKIAVIGDIILDKYIFGEVERISPEAPIPIVSVVKERFVPGGAANVAANISTLGGHAILLGVIGVDHSKEILEKELEKFSIDSSGIVSTEEHRTIQKIRVIGQNQQLLRIDYENHFYISKKLELKIIDNLMSLNNIDAIIISDYAKGTITETIVEKAKFFAKQKDILLLIDPKPKHQKWYRNVSLVTPNRKEAQAIVGLQIETEADYLLCGKKLMEMLQSNIILTAGSDGMYVFEFNQKPLHIPTSAKEVYDVSGAGDTVVATLSLAITSGANLKDAAILANKAAGIKVGKLGTAQVSREELEKINREEVCYERHYFGGRSRF